MDLDVFSPPGDGEASHQRPAFFMRPLPGSLTTPKPWPSRVTGCLDENTNDDQILHASSATHSVAAIFNRTSFQITVFNSIAR